MTLNKTHIVSLLQMIVLLLFVSYEAFSYIDAGAVEKTAYYLLIIILLGTISFLRAPDMHSLQRLNLSWIGLLAFFFVTVYLVRVLYDLYIANVPFLMTTHKGTIPFLFFCAAVVPLVLMPQMDFHAINWSVFNKCCYVIFVGMGLYSLYLNLTGQLMDSIFADGRMVGNASMDTIGFGHLGVTIVIASMAVMQERSWLWKIAGAVTIIMGVGIMFGAGSRGPMVAIVVCVLVYLYAKGYKMSAIFAIPIILLLFYLLYPVINNFFTDQGNFAIERIYNSIFRADEMEDVTSLRDALYAEMTDSFLSHPILGDSFLLKDGQYVHNFVFEAFLATGVLGGTVFLLLMACTLVYAVRLIQINPIFIFAALLFVQHMSYGMFSRSLAILPVFWFSMYCVWCVYNTYSTPTKVIV